MSSPSRNIRICEYLIKIHSALPYSPRAYVVPSGAPWRMLVISLTSFPNTKLSAMYPDVYNNQSQLTNKSTAIRVYRKGRHPFS